MVKRTAERKSGAETKRFDAFHVAARGEALAGELDARAGPRLVDRLASTDHPAIVAWKIEGGRDGRERPMLTLTVEGALSLACQRCLQPYDFAIGQRSELLLARDESELALLDAEEREVVLAATPLDVMMLVEDELLLSLPFAPMHPEGQCLAMPDPSVGGAPAEPDNASPFARLAAIKKGRGKTHEE
jgi:DUF177 domain-containing protein